MTTPRPLPADFNDWDPAQPAAQPQPLPADFRDWDAEPPKPKAASSTAAPIVQLAAKPRPVAAPASYQIQSEEAPPAPRVPFINAKLKAPRPVDPNKVTPDLASKEVLPALAGAKELILGPEDFSFNWREGMGNLAPEGWDTTKKVLRGVGGAADKMVGSPEGILMLGALPSAFTGLAGSVAGNAIKAGVETKFAYDAGKGLVDAVSDDRPWDAEKITETGLDALLAGGMARGAVKSGKHVGEAVAESPLMRDAGEAVRWKQANAQGLPVPPPTVTPRMQAAAEERAANPAMRLSERLADLGDDDLLAFREGTSNPFEKGVAAVEISARKRRNAWKPTPTEAPDMLNRDARRSETAVPGEDGPTGSDYENAAPDLAGKPWAELAPEERSAVQQLVDEQWREQATGPDRPVEETPAVSSEVAPAPPSIPTPQRGVDLRAVGIARQLGFGALNSLEPWQRKTVDAELKRRFGPKVDETEAAKPKVVQPVDETKQSLGEAGGLLDEAKGETSPPAATKHDYASTQVNLPEEAAGAVLREAARIPDEVLAEDGRESQPHVTVKYGLHDDSPAAIDTIRQVLSGYGPIKVKLGETSIFPAKESGGADVVKVDVDSPQLHNLNAAIADALPHTDTHPTYQPHVTLAYVKAGEGAKFAGNKNLAGQEITLDRIAFSDKNGKQVEIPIGEKAEVPVRTTDVDRSPKTGGTAPPPTRTSEAILNQEAGEVKPAPQVNPLDQAASEARARLDSAFKGETLSANPVGLIGDFAIIGAKHLRDIGKNYIAWARQMLSDFGDRVRPHLQRVWAESQRLLTEESGADRATPRLVESPLRSARENTPDLFGSVLSRALRRPRLEKYAEGDGHALLEDVDARYHPRAKEGDGVVYVNRPAAELLRQAIGQVNRQDVGDFNGVALAPGTTVQLVRMLGRVASGDSVSPTASASLRQLAETLARSFRRDGGRVALIVGGEGRPLGRMKATAREEVIHREQFRAVEGAESGVHVDARKFLAHADAARAARMLETEGKYSADPEEMAMEVPAKIAAGDWGRLGLTIDQAHSVMDHYFTLLSEQSGEAPVASILKRSHSEIRKGYNAQRQATQENIRGELDSSRRSGGVRGNGPDGGEAGGADSPGGSLGPGRQRGPSQGDGEPPAARNASGDVERFALRADPLGLFQSEPPNRPPARRATAAEEERPGGLSVSPNADKSWGKLIDKSGLSEEGKIGLIDQVDKYLKANPERTVMSDAEYRDMAKAVDPMLVWGLDPSKITRANLPPREVIEAAVAMKDAVQQQIAAKTAELNNLPITTTKEQMAAKNGEIDKLVRDQQHLLDIIFPIRSEHGRNLRMWKVEAMNNLDPTYWIARARRAAGVSVDTPLPGNVEPEIHRALGAVKAAEDAAIDQVAGPASKPAKPRTDRAAQAGDSQAKQPTALTPEVRLEQARKRELARLKAELEGRRLTNPLTPEQRQQLADDPEIKALREKVHALREKSKPIKPDDQVIAEEIARERGRLSRALESDPTTAKVSRLTPEQQKAVEADPVIQSLKARIIERQRQERAVKAQQARQAIPAEHRVERAAGLAIDQAERKAAIARGELPQPIPPTKFQLTPEQRRQVDTDPRVQAARRKLAEVMAETQKNTAWEVAMAFRRANLLTAPATHLRNQIGNASFQVVEEISRIPAAVADFAISHFGGTPRTVEGANPMAMARASYAAATKGSQQAMEIMRHGATAEQMAAYDFPRSMNTRSQVLNSYINGVFRSMSAADRMYKVYAIDRSLGEQMRLAKVTSPTEDMMVRAVADAEFATFNNDNKLSDAISRLKSADPAIAGAVDVILPFQKTPTNIVLRTLDYTPVGAAARMGGAIRDAFKAKGMTPEMQRKISMAVGRGATGSALLYLGYWMAQKGMMTGNRPENPAEARGDEAAGRRWGAVKLAGRWYGVSTLTPVGTLLTTGAALYEASSNAALAGMSEDDRETRIGVATAGAAAKTVLDMPLLQGGDLVGRMAKDLLHAPAQAAGSIASSFVPASSAVSGVGALLDPVRRQTKTDGIIRETMNTVAARLPAIRNQLPERIDAFGEPVPQSRLAAIDPFASTPAKEDVDPLAHEVAAEDMGFGELKKAPNESDALYTFRKKLMGAVRKWRMSEAVQSSEYQAMPGKGQADDQRREALRKANRQAATEMRNWIPKDYKIMGNDERRAWLDNAARYLGIQ